MRQHIQINPSPIISRQARWERDIWGLWMSIPKPFVAAFSTLRMIVTIGWIVYPLGYIFGEPITGGLDTNSLNVIYNLADFVNKIAFGLIIWTTAVSSGGRIR